MVSKNLYLYLLGLKGSKFDVHPTKSPCLFCSQVYPEVTISLIQICLNFQCSKMIIEMFVWS